MKVRTRVFNDPSNPGKYDIATVDSRNAVELNGKDPCLVWRMGAFQTEDVPPRTEKEVRDWMNSGDVPGLVNYIYSMAPGATRDAVIRYFMPGVKEMCHDYFAYGDEIGGHIPELEPVAKNMRVVSCDSVETPFFTHHEDFHNDLNRFHTYENTDFIWRFVAPSLGECTLEKDKEGKEFVYINRPLKAKDSAYLLGSLVVASNSAGAEMSVKDANALQKTMLLSGIDLSDQHTIASSMRNVMFGNIVPVELLTGPRPTTIVFEGFRDLVAEQLNPYKVPISPAQIERHAPAAYREKLKMAAYEYYLRCEDWVTDWGTHTLPPEPDAFDEAPFLMFQRLAPNMMRVISDVPNHRKHWISRGPHLMEEMKKVSNDGNRHHTAFYIVQGDPPHHLPALTHQVMREALALPLLKRTPGHKRMDDFFTRATYSDSNPASLAVRKLVEEGLSRAEMHYKHHSGKSSVSVAS